MPDWFDATMAVAKENKHNIYLALTKRYKAIPILHERMELLGKHFGLSGVKLFIGASITNNAQARAVISVGGADFISFEPLMEQIEPELLQKLQCKWWIVGDLTSRGVPQHRAKVAWVEDMRKRAQFFGIPMFMKDSLRYMESESMSYPTIGAFMREFPEGWKLSNVYADQISEKEIV